MERIEFKTRMESGLSMYADIIQSLIAISQLKLRESAKFVTMDFILLMGAALHVG